MLGTYTFKFPVSVYPHLVLKAWTIRVDVLAQNDTRYYVKYLQPHPNGAKAGTCHRVLKKSVTIKT